MQTVAEADSAATHTPRVVSYGPGRPAPKRPTRKQRLFAKAVSEGAPPLVAARAAGYSEWSVKKMGINILGGVGTQAALAARGASLSLAKIDEVVSAALADGPDYDVKLRAADLGYKRLGGYVTVSVNITAELDSVRGLLAQRLADRLSGAAYIEDALPPAVDVRPVIRPSENRVQGGAATIDVTVTSGGSGEPECSGGDGGQGPQPERD